MDDKLVGIDKAYQKGYEDGINNMTWISVKDRLPALSVSVLALSYKSDYRINSQMYVAWIEEFGIENKPVWQYSWCCGCFCGKEITHWQPLPDAPKE